MSSKKVICGTPFGIGQDIRDLEDVIFKMKYNSYSFENQKEISNRISLFISDIGKIRPSLRFKLPKN